MSPQPQQPHPWVKTPLKRSAVLSRAAGCQVYLKLENIQPAGSFKSRGIGHYMNERLREHAGDSKEVRFYCSSGGNAGLACVTAARDLGSHATVIVPESTPAHMIAKIQASGGDVHQHGASWQEADSHLREVFLNQDPAGVYVPPFDHPDIWAGNATCIDEAIMQLKSEDPLGRAGRPDAVVCSVGGGGLLNGVMVGLDRHGWGDSVPVLAVETRGADSLAQSLHAKQLVTLPGITSIAKSLGAVRVAAQSFAFGQRENVHSVVFSDGQAARASWRFADDERIMVESACGASLAPCYEPDTLRPLIKGFGEDTRIVIIVCGGNNVSLEILEDYRRQFGAGECSTHNGLPSSKTAPNGKA